MEAGAVRGNRSAISRIPVANTYFNKKLRRELMPPPGRGPEVPVPIPRITYRVVSRLGNAVLRCVYGCEPALLFGAHVNQPMCPQLLVAVRCGNNLADFLHCSSYLVRSVFFH